MDSREAIISSLKLVLEHAENEPNMVLARMYVRLALKAAQEGDGEDAV